jgi:hypothetical protein
MRRTADRPEVLRRLFRPPQVIPSIVPPKRGLALLDAAAVLALVLYFDEEYGL